MLQYAFGRQGVEACVAEWGPGSHAASGVFACRSHRVNLLRWPVHMTSQCAPAWVSSQCFRAKCSACNHELGVRRGDWHTWKRQLALRVVLHVHAAGTRSRYFNCHRRARQGAGYDLGGWEDHGEPQAAGEALINALRAQEDARAINRGAAGVDALCGPRCCLWPGPILG